MRRETRDVNVATSYVPRLTSHVTKGVVLMKRYILALDQGTTGSRAFVFDGRGRIVFEIKLITKLGKLGNPS